MIVVDTSAVMAIALGERHADRCEEALASADQIVMSAGTLLELLIVSAGRGIEAQTHQLLADLDMEIAPATSAFARDAAEAYRRWGKGFHPAALNFGDCFAYTLAKIRDCPLLFVGGDFAQTDVKQALG